MKGMRYRTPQEIVSGLPNWFYLIVYVFFIGIGLMLGYWIWG